jgi:hypothetical protein
VIKYFLTFLLFSVCVRLKAETDLVIKDPHDYLHFRIELNTHELFKEQKNGRWAIQGKLNYSNIDLRDFKILSNQTFDMYGNILISIEGSGQLYGLDVKNLQLSRLDSTYFRGHNFWSIKFIRKDTLYSYGGSGFWHVNNIETYFSKKSNEWELVKAPVDVRPLQMTKAFGGYDQKRDVVAVIESPPFYQKSFKDYSFTYFEKNLKSNEWKVLGEVNAQLLFKLGAKTLNSIFINGIFLFLDSDYILIGDPVKNKIFLVEKSLPLFSSIYELGEKNGFLYSYNREKHFNTTQIKVDSISIEKLKSMAVPKGDFYRNEGNEMLATSIFVLLSANILFFYFFKKRKGKRIDNKIRDLNESQLMEALPGGAFEFLKNFLMYPKGHEINSHKITELMGFASYAYETQRQVRSRMISAINTYFKAHYQMDAVILRKNLKDDKRFYVYMISEEYFDDLKAILSKRA